MRDLKASRMVAILLIEDNPGTAHEIRLELESAEFKVHHVDTGERAVIIARKAHVDAMIVDRQLSDMEGLDIIEALRADDICTPALVLSALGSLDDRVGGLRAGDDDYLPKPFALVELRARVEALLRRPNDPRDTWLIVGPIDIDLPAGTARRGARELELLPRELKLLDYLVRRPGAIVTRSMLLRDVWGYSFEPNSNVVDVHMGRLRRKVDAADDRQLIHSVRAMGYRFDVPD